MNPATTFRFVLLLALAAAGGAAAASDEDFLAARDAFRAGDRKKLDQLAARLQGHVLQPYVAYWQLRGRLEEAAPEAIRAYLAAHRDTPLSDRLRADWLRQLGRAQQWELFDAEYPQLVADDVELTCYALQSRVRLDALALREARPLWFVARELPDSCNPLFTALAAAQQLSVEDVWTRVRLALEAGQVTLAGRVAAMLPPAQAPDVRVLTAIASNPAAYLEKPPPDLKSRAARETLMFAVYRLARTSPQQAAAHWSRLEARFDGAERAYVWGQIAHFGAVRHDPSALDWYAKAGDLSDLQLAWKARAALRARNWREVVAAVDAMTPREAGEGGWRYWKARALKALGREQEALAILKPLSHEFSFYGQLAVEDLGGRIDVPAPAFRPTAEEVRAMGQLPGIRRALALYRLNLRFDANREWLWAIRDFDDRRLLIAAEVARRHDIYDRVINTAERTAALHDFNLRYLAPYRDVLKAHAAKMELDEAWVYGLIRQESRFIASARSHAGASGLMQLMPATAKWVAKKLGLKDWRWSEVNEVDTNVSLGTYYLRHVLDVLDGHPVLASAAYNAGPGRARAWRPDSAMEGAIYAETIPFNETRDYVKKVMANATYYAHTFGQQLQSLKQRLGTVTPRQREREPALGDTP
jgi:soluble lytic murein transglycosylase